MTAIPDEFRLHSRFSLRRGLLWIIFRPLFDLLFKVRVEGRQHVPRRTAYVIAYNHVSLFEPPLLLGYWPEFPEPLAGHDVWERKGQGLLVKAYGAIPVRRGEYDRQVMDTMLRVLQNNRPLMISPEGGRSHKPGMRRALPGVAYMMDRARVPVVPVAIFGTRDDLLKDAFHFKRPLIHIRIGEPFMLPPITAKGEERRLARQRNVDEVMLRLAAMLPPEYHGVYAGMLAGSEEQ